LIFPLFFTIYQSLAPKAVGRKCYRI